MLIYIIAVIYEKLFTAATVSMHCPASMDLRYEIR